MSKKLNKSVPKLRFPKFKGDWQQSAIEEIALVSSGGTPSRSESSFWNGDIPWVTTSEIGQAEIYESAEKITKKGLESSSAKILKKDAILLAMYGQGKTRGQVSILKIEAATNQACAAITLKNNYDPEFLYYFLFREYERLRLLSNDGSQKNLSAGLIKQYNVPATSQEEQEKIASFLGAIDTRLTQLRRKHKLLQTYKRGVMQKIFSQEVRFKGAIGTAFPDWKEKELKSIATVNPPSNYFPDQFLYIDLERVNNGLLSEPELINKEDAPSRAQRVLQKGDILYQTVRPYQRNNLFFNLDGDYIASTGYAQLRAKENQQFLYQLIYSDSFVDKVISRCTGTSYPAINSSDLANVSIFFPTSIKEQEKIADFLTAIDQKIEAVARQVDRTEHFKKGLLQKMFV